MKGYDYSSPGFYFVTICTRNREKLLCEIVNGTPIMARFGDIVQEEWEMLPGRFPNVELGEFTVMPNHVHGIIRSVGAGLAPARNSRMSESAVGSAVKGSPATFSEVRAGASPAPTHRLGEIIGAFESLSDRRCRSAYTSNNPGKRFGRLWQRNFHDRVIRDDIELKEIREYIRTNPSTWERDENYVNTKNQI